MDHSAATPSLTVDPLHAVDWPVRTERLVLRRATDADIDEMWRFRQLPEVGMWLSAAPDTFPAFRQRMVAKRSSTVAVLLAESDASPSSVDDASPTAGVLIGDLMIRVEDGWAQDEVTAAARNTQAEIGWAFDPAFHGRGYATEAVRAAISLCFDQLRLRRVHAGCFADNVPSWKLMERVGMRREEHSRKSAFHRSGEWVDGMSYGLLAEEWTG